jgi:hypothetical protein
LGNSDIDVETYGHLWTSLGEELGHGIIPAFDCSFDRRPPLPQDSKNIETLLANRHAICINYIADVSNQIYESEQRIFWEGKRHQDSHSLIALLVEHALIPQSISHFQGRRLTLLQDGRLALVPSSTLAGDIVVCLAGSEIPYVLRPVEDQEEVPDDIIRGVFNPDQRQPGMFDDPLGCRRCQDFRVLNLLLSPRSC